MSLTVYIKFKESRETNYFLDHPYIYDNLSEGDKTNFREESYWSANITHNLGKMASKIPINFKGIDTTLYKVCWRPEEIGIKAVEDILPLLRQGIYYMLDHRKELEQYNPENSWGDYNRFMKFLLNYKQACEDNDPECTIKVSR